MISFLTRVARGTERSGEDQLLTWLRVGGLRPVQVDPKKVQESGLIKDTINLDVPTGAGDFSTALLKRGTEKLRGISKAWATYAEQQEEPHTVVPLMVLQVPNNPDPGQIATWLDKVFETWSDLPEAYQSCRVWLAMRKIMATGTDALTLLPS